MTVTTGDFESLQEGCARCRPCIEHHAAERQTLVVNLAGGVANRVFQANSVGFQRAILGLMRLKCLSVARRWRQKGMTNGAKLG